MSQSNQENADDVVSSTTTLPQPKEWVKFEEDAPAASSTPKKNSLKDTDESSVTTDSVTVDINHEGNEANKSNPKEAEHYSGAVISTKPVQINLDRSGLSRSMNAETQPQNLPSGATAQNINSASLKTIDLRDPSNGRNIVTTALGSIRQGFANGDTIVTLLPVNTRWPWITPAKFRPELVPEELMAQGLTLTVEDYVHIMELLVNDIRFNLYNICYKRILVVWIFTAFVVLLALLFSGVTGVALFTFGIMWLILNAAAIFLCMFIKIRLNHNLERCMARVNKHLLQHKILLGLDDRGKISCHKVNLCFIYFDTTDCIKKLQEVIEREERDGRIISSHDNNSQARRQQELQQRMDIDDSDIVIQGTTTTRISRKQRKSELLLCRYSQRWAKDYLRRRLDWTVDEDGGNPSSPLHLSSALCPCQYIEEWLRNKCRLQSRDCCPQWSSFFRDRGM